MHSKRSPPICSPAEGQTRNKRRSKNDISTAKSSGLTGQPCLIPRRVVNYSDGPYGPKIVTYPSSRAV